MIAQVKPDSQNVQGSKATTSNQLVSIDVGQYRLGIEAGDLVGVRDADQTSIVSVLGKNSPGRLVRISEGVVRAIDLRNVLSTSDNTHAPLVLVRAAVDQAADQITPPTSSEILGFFVDSVSRPASAKQADRYPIPSWVRQKLTLPCKAWIRQSNDADESLVRLILDASGFSRADWEALASTYETPESVESAMGASKPKSSGRGLLVFAPAECLTEMTTVIAIPMSMLASVEQSAVINKLPSNDRCLEGVTNWNGKPIPVVALGNALGLAQAKPAENQALSFGSNTRNTAGSPLLVIRTPQNNVFGCLAGEQIRSIRTPKTIGPHPNSGIAPNLLLGAFMTTAGPMVVPDLDALLTVSRVSQPNNSLPPQTPLQLGLERR